MRSLSVRRQRPMRLALLATVGLFAVAGANAEPSDLPPLARAYLTDYLGRWEAQVTVFGPDGAVVRESRGEFGETVLLEGRINLHTSYNADGTQNKAFRYYDIENDRFCLVDVTWKGVLWVLFGDAEHGGDVMTSAERELPDGRKVTIRFTHTNRQEDSFEATMEVSMDSGSTWRKRSHTTYRRLGADEQGRAAFEKLATYLSNGSGRWRTPNDRHDPSNARSPEALGLWFERKARGRVLELTIVGYFGGEARPGIKSYWFWHPGRREIIYEEISPSGAVRSGTAAFVDDVTFVTLTQALDASGKPVRNKGENIMLDEGSHRTIAYARGPDGGWVEQRALTWQLEPSK